MATDGEVWTTANKRQKRTINEKSRIFFVVEQSSLLPDCKLWYQIDLNDFGSGAQRLEKQPPFFIDSAVGSCDSFLYSLGGFTFTYPEGFTHSDGYPALQKAFTDTYFYNTTNPDSDWFPGPHMRSPRDRLSHQVIGSKIYVLGGAYISLDYYDNGWDLPHLIWGEYLDVSLPRNEWQWLPVETRHDEGFTSGGLLDNEDYISSLPLFEGGFDPERHILCRCDTRRFRFLCYNVDDGSLCKVFERDDLFKFNPVMNVYVEGDYIVAPDSMRVLVIGTFRTKYECWSCPWFVGDIQSAANPGFIPPMPKRIHSWIFRNPCAFALLRIAPYKYVSLWFPEPDKPYVSLSVFTICPPHPPPPPGSVDPDTLLRMYRLCMDHVPATFEKLVHIPLHDCDCKKGHFEIKGSVAM